MLARDLRTNEEMRKAQDPNAKSLIQEENEAALALLPEKYQPQQQDVDVLVKLLPYYEVELHLKASENPKARYVRQLLQITRSDAEMFKNKKCKRFTKKHGKKEVYNSGDHLVIWLLTLKLIKQPQIL